MQGQSTFKLLHGFLGGNDGANPTSGVIFGPNGYIYGTTLDGGSYNQGTVFSISPGGRYRLLHTFTGGVDGGTPNNQLTWVGTSLYGTTDYGGDYKVGTIFEIDPATGAATTLYSFRGGADGAIPDCAMISDTAGDLYGTALRGGANTGGTVFRFEPSNRSLTTLYSFEGGADGQYPSGRMVRDPWGNLYGATFSGGAHSYGTVFKLSSSGAESVLYSFLGPENDISWPDADLSTDSQGNLYGGGGGNAQSVGNAVFKISKTGEETLYAAPSGDSGTSAGVVMDSAGNLYGTLAIVGYYGGVFKMDTTGTYSILYSFTGGLDGTTPGGAGVIRDAKGNLYGTTNSGGVGIKYGTVFELTFP